MTKSSKMDPLGNALKDYLKGKRRGFIDVISNIEESDNLWVKQFFRTYTEMPEVERIALRHCEGKILDVGAGGGAHSLHLKEKGFEVKPIDTSEGAVEVMQSQGLKNSECIDFFEFQGGKYDTILMLMNGIGIVGEIKRLTEFFNKASELLGPGGQIIFDSSDIIYMYENSDGNFEMELDKYYGEVVYKMKYGQETGEAFKWLFVDFNRFKSIAEQHHYSVELLCKTDHYSYCCRCRPIER